MNNVALVGRLTKDPELRYTQTGIATCNFTLAVNRPFSNQDGKKEADFINIVVWRKQAENVAQFLGKGSQAAVNGRIQTRNYENSEGRRVYVTEVVAESVQFLDSRKKDGANQGGDWGDQSQQGGGWGGQNNQSNQQRNGGQGNRNQENGNQSGWGRQNNQSEDPFQTKDPFSGGGKIDITDDDLPF